MRFLPRLAAKPALVSLTGQEVVGHARGEFGGEEVEEGGDGDDRVRATDIYFPVVLEGWGGREGKEGRSEYECERKSVKRGDKLIISPPPPATPTNLLPQNTYPSSCMQNPPDGCLRAKNQR